GALQPARPRHSARVLRPSRRSGRRAGRIRWATGCARRSGGPANIRGRGGNMIKTIAALAIGAVLGVARALFLLPTQGAVRDVTHDWRRDVKELRIGVTGPENAAARIGKLDKYAELLKARLGIPVSFVQATDYDGIVQAMAAKQIELGIVGASAYAAIYDE